MEHRAYREEAAGAKLWRCRSTHVEALNSTGSHLNFVGGKELLKLFWQKNDTISIKNAKHLSH